MPDFLPLEKAKKKKKKHKLAALLILSHLAGRFPYHMSLRLFFSNCRKLHRWSWRKVQGFLTAFKRFQLIEFTGNFSTQHFFWWKLPAPCGGGLVPTNYSLQQRQPEGARGRRGQTPAGPRGAVFVTRDIIGLKTSVWEVSSLPCCQQIIMKIQLSHALPMTDP